MRSLGINKKLHDNQQKIRRETSARLAKEREEHDRRKKEQEDYINAEGGTLGNTLKGII